METAEFVDTYGRDPEGLWFAPGRVNLIGEHTDYNDGFVLPFALPQRTVAAAALRDDDRVRVASAQQPADPVCFRASTQPGDVPGWAAYAAGVVWALTVRGHDVPGLDLLVDSDVPPGAGLSSSASLECAVAVALDDLLGLHLDPVELALIAQQAENDYVSVPCGVMDQMASMLGRRGHVLFLDARSLDVEHVPCPLEEAGLSLLVVDTRAPHRLVDGEYADRRRSCEQGAAALGIGSLRDSTLDQAGSLEDDRLRRRARHVISENARVLEVVSLLREGRIAETGPQLTASHVSLRDDYEVSSPEQDVAVDTLLSAGALGARMTGAGFGGCVLALVEAGATDAITEKVMRAFAEKPFDHPVTFVTSPAPGAGRLR